MLTENEISFIIRGIIYKVYNALGPGLLESVYVAALVFELKKLDYMFKLKFLFR